MSLLLLINNDNASDEQQLPLDETFEALRGEEEESKCGEIYVKNSGSFTLICVLCKASFENMLQFGEHVRSNHLHEDVLVMHQSDILSGVKFELKEETQSEQEFLEDCPAEDRLHEDSDSEPDFMEFPSEPKYSCDICKLEYKTKSSLNRHNKRHKENEEDSPPEENSSTAQTADVSEKSKKTSFDPKWFCEICNRQLRTQRGFRYHSLKHKSAPLAVEEDPGYLTCKFCDIKLSDKSEWMEHEKTHNSARPFPCPHCDKTFSKRQNVQMHINCHTGERPFKCPHCSKGFAHSNNLNWHIKGVHLQIKPFKCDLCDKRFTRKIEKTIHLRQHTGEKPYQCEECGKKFMLAAQMNEHRKQHKTIKDIKCDTCGKCFFSKKRLQKHQVIHSGKRAYTCSICGHTFVTGNALATHKRLHSDVKEYVCSICGREFAQAAGLYSHRKSHGAKINA